VAATRARTELHLLGTAIVKRDGHELGSGSSRSLLGIAWDALKDDFARAHAEQEPEVTTPQQTEFDFGPSEPSIRLRRLPADWKPRESAVAITAIEPVVERIERPRAGLAARAFGTVVHALLEDLAGRNGVDAAVIDEVKGWRQRATALLRAAGLPRTEAESQSGDILRALLAVLNDANGRWILGARASAQTEASWSTWASDDIVRTLRGDRIFRAGATPCSREETHLWIVDYKTARHGESGLDAFLQTEKEKYLGQLEAYAAVMRKVHGEDTALRLALYYPLLTRLVWW
jgi:ATP-dependent helicase/nuclease subunit A